MTINETKIQVPWSGRGLAYTDDEISIVTQVMSQADPLTQGRFQDEFEKNFCSLTSAHYSFAVSSCTAALELSALLCQLSDQDEVIIPAHTFAASAIPFARTGAKLIWADIDPATRVVTVEKIRPLITKKTKVIVVVHLYGLVCDMDPIIELASEYNLLIVEDAAQALGVKYKNKYAGTIGDFGCFSFHTHKNISTLGEGGMLVVKSAQHAAKIPGLRHNGMRSFSEERQYYWKPAMSNVDFDIDGLWPYNFCLGEVQCALGSKLLERLETINQERKIRALRFINSMQKFPELVFQKVPDNCEHAWHLLTARYASPQHNKSRDEFIATLAFSYGVKAVVQYCPLYRYPMFQKAGFGSANCPETDYFFDNMISFPFQHWMPEAQFENMIQLTQQALEQLRKE